MLATTAVRNLCRQHLIGWLLIATYSSTSRGNVITGATTRKRSCPCSAFSAEAPRTPEQAQARHRVPPRSRATPAAGFNIYASVHIPPMTVLGSSQ